MRGQKLQSTAGNQMNGLTFYSADAAARLAAAHAVIWDLDHTLYRVCEAQHKNFNAAVAAAVVAYGLPLTIAAAQDMAAASFAQYHNSFRIFIERYGLDPRKLHFDYHARADARTITPFADVPALFAPLQDRAHLILTQASRHWAERAIAHIGLAELFPSTRLIAYEDYNFAAKYDDPAGPQMALKLLDFPAEEVAMVEDNAYNLEVPHRLGLLTVHICYEQPLTPPREFVSVSAERVQDVLRALAPK